MLNEITNLGEITRTNGLDRNEDYMKREIFVRGIHKYKWPARHKIDRSDYTI